MWKQIQTSVFSRSVNGLQIEVSDLENSGLLGAASLHYDRK
jgi:glucokinase